MLCISELKKQLNLFRSDQSIKACTKKVGMILSKIQNFVWNFDIVILKKEKKKILLKIF